MTRNRLYRTLDRLLAAQSAIEQDLKDWLGTLFKLDYDLSLHDLTSSYFEGLAAENELALPGLLARPSQRLPEAGPVVGRPSGPRASQDPDRIED